MEIKITLLDVNYCNGCPLYQTAFGFHCNLFKKEIEINYQEGLLKRPKKCIEKNGL